MILKKIYESIYFGQYSHSLAFYTLVHLNYILHSQEEVGLIILGLLSAKENYIFFLPVQEISESVKWMYTAERNKDWFFIWTTY